MIEAEIAQYLNDLNLGFFNPTTANGNIYIMMMPSAPDDLIALYSRGGSGSDGKLGYDSINVEIIIRGVNVITTQQKAQNIYNLLHGFHNKRFITNGTWIISSLGQQSYPNFIGKDENLRYEFSLNFVIEIKNFEGGRNNGGN